MLETAATIGRTLHDVTRTLTGSASTPTVDDFRVTGIATRCSSPRSALSAQSLTDFSSYLRGTHWQLFGLHTRTSWHARAMHTLGANQNQARVTDCRLSLFQAEPATDLVVAATGLASAPTSPTASNADFNFDVSTCGDEASGRDFSRSCCLRRSYKAQSDEKQGKRFFPCHEAQPHSPCVSTTRFDAARV